MDPCWFLISISSIQVSVRMRKNTLQWADSAGRACDRTRVGCYPYERSLAAPQKAAAHAPLPFGPSPIGYRQAVLPVSVLGPAPLLRNDEYSKPTNRCFDSHFASPSCVCLCACRPREGALQSSPGLPGFSSSLEETPCCCCHERNLAVANGFKSVHPSGHPINHSTHVGFSCPETG